jgi:hypothetical protein
VGVAHPSPAKAALFKSIDLVSVEQAAKAAAFSGIRHFIYLSVAMHPTRIMRDFQAVRARGESILLQQPYASSFIRPWYVLGPGHWWPVFLKPVYWLLKLWPGTRQTARDLDTVTIRQVTSAIMKAIENQPQKNAVYDVRDMREI